MAAAYPFDASLTAWISRGFETLEARVAANTAAVHFDVLVIGSGYGGAVAAMTFAGRTAGGQPVRVGVLERGKEYLPGSFPTGLRELPRHVRQKRNKEGLFDIRLGPEVNAVLANGLGGGSLINAGVMAEPLSNVFATGWPAALATLPAQLYFNRAREMLGSRRGGVPNTILLHPGGAPQKYHSIKAIAPNNTFSAAEITVAMTKTKSSGDVTLEQCKRCADCATGCNFGAKNSLDVNLLVNAHQNGAELYSGATVLHVEKEIGGTWLVHCVHTNAKLRARAEDTPDAVTRVRARKVVLAAGALGSPEILLRSKKAAGLAVSSQLGKRCSTNGDMLIVDYDTKDDVDTVADESLAPSVRNIGPTITGMIDLRNTDGVVIEEMSVPAGLRLAFTEIFSSIDMLHSLDTIDSDRHKQEFPDDDIYAVPKKRIKRSALYAVMADDGALGTIELVDGDTLGIHDDGVARIRWEDDPSTTPKDSLPELPVFDHQVETLKKLTKKAKTRGRILPNPVWRLLPKRLAWLLKDQRGPPTTVHPLGGCAMADTAAAGAVDDCGRVFSPGGAALVHDGLVVLDGSIIPTALGTNPALTIASVALRAAENLATQWGYVELAGKIPLVLGAPIMPAKFTRPEYRKTDAAFAPPPTEVEIIERLVGPVDFAAAGGATKTRIVELTLRFQPKAVTELSRPPLDGGNAVLNVAVDPAPPATASRIRIYDESVWKAMERRWTPERRFEDELEAIALFSAPLTGTLQVFQRQRSRARSRIRKAIRAYWLNRGERDAHQFWTQPDDGGPSVGSRLRSAIALASRSGEIRALTYDLTVGAPEAPTVLKLSGTKRRIEGHKRFTYARRANPWRQLMEVELQEFPGLKKKGKKTLKLDPRHLVRVSTPLFRIVRQHDGMTALADLGGFVGYFLRLLLGLHLWSFREPDPDKSGHKPDLKPSLNLPGLPPGVRYPVPIPLETPDGGGAAFAGEVLLTRFPKTDSDLRPILFLHGYSASGTTFAHHAVPDNFASHFWHTKRDVWIADLRTSPAHPRPDPETPASAERHWSFEQIGRRDVPVAINKVLAETGAERIDIVAHCMGTVVFSMAVLDPNPLPFNDVVNQVERVAFTQVGPLVVFSPANIFRGFVMRYFIDFVPEEYSFRPPDPTFVDDLLDRLLATLPYPVEEFDKENPRAAAARTPWTRTRHRMDALYGRDFSAVNMEKPMLRYIDDHFGALSLRTVAQTMHFARYSMITNYEGHNEFVSRPVLAARWTFPTFSVHGAQNGLAHVSTVDRMRQVLDDAGCLYLPPKIIEDGGHQDVLVGTKRAEALTAIEQFLTDPITAVAPPRNDKLVAYAPWIGPIITEQRERTPAAVLRVGTAPTHRMAEGVVMLRVSIDGDRLVRPDDPHEEWDATYVISHMALYKSTELTNNRWDAFEAPLPSVMPGHNGMDLGDGLLVLVIYDEAPSLAKAFPVLQAKAYFMADPATETVSQFYPVEQVHGAVPEPLAWPEDPVDYRYFKRAAAALVDALVKQPERADDKPARDRVGHAVLLHQTVTQQLELIVKGLTDPPTYSTTQLVFGTNPETGTTVAEALDQDRDLLDGVVPYDPPTPPIPMPVPAGTRFALLSCQYPAGLLDDPVAYASYGRLLGLLDQPAATRPRFAVLTGDQVYVDPTAGLYDPSASENRYHRPYEAWLRQRNVRGVLRRVPSFMMLDDQEIDDKWEPLPGGSPGSAANDAKRASGTASYWRYQRGMPPAGPAPPTPFTFRFDGFPFFMLDTRTDRSARRATTVAASDLFKDATLTELKDWLTTAGAGPKFIVSPAMLLPRHRRALQHVPPGGALSVSTPGAIHVDGWDGYPKTLIAVLGFIAEKAIGQVVFLSGDEHCGYYAEIELRDEDDNLITRAHSLHTTAAYAPFPFANVLSADLVLQETIPFSYNGVPYSCAVNATPSPARDGVALLRPWHDGSAWKLDYEFTGGIGGGPSLTL